MSKSCELHLVPNCPLCAKTNSTPQPPVAISPVPVTPQQYSPAPQTPPESKITDPTAQKMLAAAGKYAQECEAVKTISEAVTRLTEVLAESKNKLKEAETNRDAAQKEMMVLLGGKS